MCQVKAGQWRGEISLLVEFLFSDKYIPSHFNFPSQMSTSSPPELAPQERLSSAPGFQKIDISTQCVDLLVLDKQIADESEGMLLPLNSPVELRDFLAKHRSTNILFNDAAGKHVGYFSFCDRDDDPTASELLNIGVLRDFQRLGYATKMMEHYFSLNSAKTKFVLVTKPTNLGAIRFYDKFKYVNLGLKEHYYGPEEHRVWLERA